MVLYNIDLIGVDHLLLQGVQKWLKSKIENIHKGILA
jgi:hypothetical protein